MNKNPKDKDIVTHETMHLIQSYGGTSIPGWLVEGIADYTRFKYGVHNPGGGWSLPEYSFGQNF